MADPDMRVLEVEEWPKLGRKLIRKPFMVGVAYLVKALRPILSEKIQVDGIENVIKDGKAVKGPCLWLLKHETMFDPANLIPLWLDHPARPDMKLPGRIPQLGWEKVLNKLVLQWFVMDVYRPDRGEVKEGKDVAWMRDENKGVLETIRRHYLAGVHGAIFPEGTTDTDGSILPIKPGCYNLAKMEREDGVIDIVPNMPVGVTSETLATRKHPLTKKRRYKSFVRFGKLFFYEPVDPIAGESERDYIKRDIKNHTGRVREALVNLNTFTTSQLACEYIVAEARDKGDFALTRDGLESIVRARIGGLKKIDGLVFDHGLLNDYGLNKRLNAFYETLKDEGYLSDSGEIDSGRVLDVPGALATYKLENPVLYSSNRISQLCDYRKDIKDVFK